MSQLSLCIAASGGGYQTSQGLPILSVADATNDPTKWHESLKLVVIFGTLDVVSNVLAMIPEPHCQAIGQCLSIPSMIMSMFQFFKLVQQRRQNPQ